MDEMDLFTIAASIVASLFGVLTLVIGWVGSRVIIKQDQTMEKLDIFKHDFTEKLNVLNIRIVKLETMINE